VLVAILPVLLVLVVWTAARPSVPAWVPWLGPLGLAIGVLVAWRRNVTCRGCGDPQPGLVALVGGVSVGILLAGLLVGYAVRARRAQKR
jgi:hypothetical protein